jgi:hypothetical protein
MFSRFFSTGEPHDSSLSTMEGEASSSITTVNESKIPINDSSNKETLVLKADAERRRRSSVNTAFPPSAGLFEDAIVLQPTQTKPSDTLSATTPVVGADLDVLWLARSFAVIGRPWQRSTSQMLMRNNADELEYCLFSYSSRLVLFAPRESGLNSSANLINIDQSLISLPAIFRLIQAAMFYLSLPLNTAAGGDAAAMSPVPGTKAYKVNKSAGSKRAFWLVDSKFATLFSAAYLRLLGLFPSALDAFEYYLERRLSCNRSMVTMSLKRYLRYLDIILAYALGERPPKLLNLSSMITVKTIVICLPSIQKKVEQGDKQAWASVEIEIYQGNKMVWNSHLLSGLDKTVYSEAKVEYQISDGLELHDDVSYRILYNTQRASDIHRKVLLASYSGHLAFTPVSPVLTLNQYDFDHISSEFSWIFSQGSFMRLALDVSGHAISSSSDGIESPSNEQQGSLRSASVDDYDNSLELQKVIINTIPSLNGSGSFSPLLEIHRLTPTPELVFTSDSLRRPAAIKMAELTRGRTPSFESSNSKLYLEDPVYMDDYIILFRMQVLDETGAGASGIQLDIQSVYMLLFFHVDPDTSDRVLAFHCKLKPSLLSPGLIR